MKRKHVHPGQSIGLRLSAAERTLLVEDILVPDHAYITRIKDAPADRPQVAFTLDELDDLAGYVAAEANHCENKKKQKALDAVHGKIQHLLETHTDDEDEARSDVLADAVAAGIDPKAFNPLNLLLAELEGMGLNVDSVLDGIKAKEVSSEDKLPVRITASEKQMLMGLSGLSEAIRTRIDQTPPRKQTIGFTLREVAELEFLVAPQATKCSDKKLARKWKAIHSALTDVQFQYIDRSEPQAGLSELMTGKPVSPAAALQDMVRKLIDARKKRG